MKYIVYKTTCLINGKIYIGKHRTENPEVFDGYLGNSVWVNRTDRINNPQFPFHFAVKKYGVENFKRETLFIFDTEEEAYAKEAELVTEEFIKREDTYNVILGGKGGKQLPKPVYQFDFAGNLLREFKYGLIEAGKIVGVSWSNIQYAIKAKRQSAHFFWSYLDQIDITEYTLPNFYYLYDINGNYVREFETAIECAQYLDCNKNVIYQKSNSTDQINGFFISTKKLNKITINISPITGKLNRYTLDGKYIDSFNTVKEAKEKLNLRLSSISMAVKKNGGICNGFRWTRTDNPTKTIEIIKSYRPKTAVLVYDTNGNLVKEYESARLCEKDYPAFRSVIYGRAKTCHGLIFKYK